MAMGGVVAEVARAAGTPWGFPSRGLEGEQMCYRWSWSRRTACRMAQEKKERKNKSLAARAAKPRRLAARSTKGGLPRRGVDRTRWWGIASRSPRTGEHAHLLNSTQQDLCLARPTAGCYLTPCLRRARAAAAGRSRATVSHAARARARRRARPSRARSGPLLRLLARRRRRARARGGQRRGRAPLPSARPGSTRCAGAS
jgi:hypothetical protein